MALNYAWEKFHLAVHGLALSTQSLQQRLADAFYNLSLIEEKDVKPETWSGLKELELRLTQEQRPGGTIAATTSVMSEDDARVLIEKIVSLHDDVARQYARSRNV